MKKPLRVMMILLTVSAVWAHPLFAQTSQPKLRPIEAGKAMKDMGSKALSWLFYPTFGTGPIDFDYWHVVAFYRWAELGTTMEMYVNGGGMQKHRKMTGSTATCAQPTVFDIKRVRAVLNP